MGRPKCFDEDRVLDAALDCFWRNGLRASSIRTLANEMGIAGPSLYNAYGSKQTLFEKAMERYAETALRPRFERLDGKPPLEAVRLFLMEFVENAINDGDAKGCLFVNTAIETSVSGDELSEAAKGYLDEVRQFYLAKLKAAQAAGDLPVDKDPAQLAEMLFVVSVGLCVRARTGPGRAEMEAAIAPALDLLAAAK